LSAKSKEVFEEPFAKHLI